MTQTFATNENNDLYIGKDGNLAIVNGLEAVLQACQTATRLKLGEAKFNIELGIPYFESVFNGITNLQHYENVLRETLKSVQGVIGILNLNIEVKDNSLNYSVEIITQFGNSILEGQV